MLTLLTHRTAPILPLCWKTWLCGAIALVFLWLAVSPEPAVAASCRAIAGETICLLQINRSAKNHWEYRVTLSRNGQPEAPALCNCRDRRWLRSGKSQSFQTEDVGDWICSTLSPRLR